MIDLSVQILLAFTGLVAIWLTQQKNDRIKKYAPVFGLIGQPLWYYTTLSNEQYGIFCLTLAYTYMWGMGFYNQWIKSQQFYFILKCYKI